MKEEIKIFFTALMFYTRIPCPKNITHDSEILNKATRYFSLIGWIVGIISFLAYLTAATLFNHSLGILFSLIAGVLVTGALHEDGLSDVSDGFGGGWTKEKILDIMKDSRIGVFGTISLVFLFLLKFIALRDLLIKYENWLFIMLIFISYHSLARLTSINIVFNSKYTRDDEKSKVKPVAKSYTSKEIIGVYFFGLVPLIFLVFHKLSFAAVLLPLSLLYLLSKRYFEKWLDGYTGDCLGAVEQLAECVCLLFYLFLWKYI